MATQPRFSAEIDPALGERIADAALRAFSLLGCRDYVRVDIRVDRSGQIFILEVNANPDAGPRAGLAKALRRRDRIRRICAAVGGDGSGANQLAAGVRRHHTSPKRERGSAPRRPAPRLRFGLVWLGH